MKTFQPPTKFSSRSCDTSAIDSGGIGQVECGRLSGEYDSASSDENEDANAGTAIFFLC